MRHSWRRNVTQNQQIHETVGQRAARLAEMRELEDLLSSLELSEHEISLLDSELRDLEDQGYYR